MVNEITLVFVFVTKSSLKLSPEFIPPLANRGNISHVSALQFRLRTKEQEKEKLVQENKT